MKVATVEQQQWTDISNTVDSAVELRLRQQQLLMCCFVQGFEFGT
jgi:hypothetical protein